MNGYRGYFLGVKYAGREVDQSPSSNTEVKNEWRCTSNPLINLHEVGRKTCDCRKQTRDGAVEIRDVSVKV